MNATAASAAILTPLRSPARKAPIPVDTGFIVYNEATYPNLTALFDHLDVPTQLSDMSFAVSLANGELEYSGSNLSGLFAEKRNLFRPRFWSMLRDLHRFYREAPRDLAVLEQFHTTLGDYLDAGAYGAAFRRDHLLPMAAAIWSAPAATILDYPAAAFIRFQDSHGLLASAQPAAVADRARRQPRLCRAPDRVLTPTASGLRQASPSVHRSDDLRQSPRLQRPRRDLRRCRDRRPRRSGAGDAGRSDRRRNGGFSAPSATAAMSRCCTPIHRLMPRRRAVWSSWNHIGGNSDEPKRATARP